MSRFLRGLQSIVAIVNMTGVVIVVVTLTCMFLALLTNVVLRYVFDNGITWAYEIHNILLPWLVAGGAVMATAKGSNIAVMALVDILPELWRRLFAIVVHAFVAVMSVGVVYSSIPILRASRFSHLAETGIAQSYGYASMLYAFAAIALISVCLMLRLLLGEKAGMSDPTAVSFS